MQRSRMAYESLAANDDVPMTGLAEGQGGGLTSGRRRQSDNGPPRSGRTRELYDAFGEVSDDDDEDADEGTRLNPNNNGSRGGGRGGRGDVGGNEVGFHSGFLDDDEEGVSPGASRTDLRQGAYRDEP